MRVIKNTKEWRQGYNYMMDLKAKSRQEKVENIAFWGVIIAMYALVVLAVYTLFQY